jgi:hypothetical protein
VPTYTNRGNALVPLAGLGLALLLFTYFHPGVRTRRDEDAAERGEAERAVVDLEERRRARSG